MTPEKIREVVLAYQTQLTEMDVKPARIDPTRKFGECSADELLSHAAFACINTLKFIENPDKLGKANRHLTVIQMCMSFANIYTLEDLMNHNRPN